MNAARWLRPLALVAVAGLLAGACSSGGTSTSGGGGTKKDKVTLQLKWVTQAQFAGYYAAKDQGYYDAEGLDVTILPGGPDITPEQVVAGGAADIGINWTSSTLVQRDQGVDIVTIAQIFTRSGVTEIAWADTGIKSFADMRGKKVGVWCCGNQYQQFAALTKAGIDPNKSSEVTIVDQPFNMDLFLNRDVDAASAMTYNELAQVLEVKNPKTGQLYSPSDLTVLPLAQEGTAMLEDAVFVRGDWIKDAKNQDIAKRFLKASIRGWIFCRDNLDKCVDIVLKNGPTLGAGHQKWQMNEVNKLIWPAPNGIGLMDANLFKITNDIASTYGLIKKPADPAATYRNDLVQAALDELKSAGVDVTGTAFQPQTVQVTEGGK
jgi:NitT/TauT family transport system substrate-binding protein